MSRVKKKKKSLGFKIFITIISILLVLVLAGVGVFYATLSKLDNVELNKENLNGDELIDYKLIEKHTINYQN